MIISLFQSLAEWILSSMTEVYHTDSLEIAFALIIVVFYMSLTSLSTLLVLGYVFKHREIFMKKREVIQFTKQFDSNSPDIIIVGSGVGGSAMAATLARDGRNVTVIERDMKKPDRIVGELLQPGGVNALRHLGLGDCILGLDAHQIKGYVLHNMKANTEVIVPYPEKEKTPEISNVELVTEGTAFHHGRFIMSLREQASKESNVTYVVGTVIGLIEENGVVTGVKYRKSNDLKIEELYAPLTFVVDGCFSKLRKTLVSETVRVTSHFVGLLLNHCPQKKANHAELVLGQTSPVLIYQISSDSTRVLVDIKGVLPKDLKSHLLEKVAPHLPDHIKDSFEDGVTNGRVRSMPNSFLPPSPIERPGVIVLGDAMNMRHPLTGGGMSVCLNDVVIWRDLLRNIQNLSDYNAIMDAQIAFHVQRKGSHSFVVNVLAQALYELFAATNIHLINMKEACLAYFDLGGGCVSGPVSLLSVLNPKPHILIGHFIAVAVYAVYSVFKSEPLWAIHRVVYRSVMILLSACGVLLPLVWSEMKSFMS